MGNSGNKMYIHLKVLVTQSCLTVCDPGDCSPPGSSVHGIFQAKILEWVAIPFSMGSSQPRDQTVLSYTASRFFTIWATREALYPPTAKSLQSCPTLCNPKDYTVHGILQARILEWAAFLFSRGSSQPRDLTQALQADSLPSEPPGKPMNTGMGSLCLLQGIFPIQQSNQGLLHWRWILYQLSYQRSPQHPIFKKLDLEHPFMCHNCLSLGMLSTTYWIVSSPHSLQ